MIWLHDVKSSMHEMGGVAALKELYPVIEERHLRCNHKLPRHWKSIVRETLERHSSDSASYDGSTADIFYSIGHGVWGLRKPRVRCGTVRCPIWSDIGVDGQFDILIHYRRGVDGEPVFAAAFSRYNGVLSNISEEMRNLRLVPDWRQRVSGRDTLSARGWTPQHLIVMDLQTP